MTHAAQQDTPVHRLIDMVVEEVSLVDRAANKHRFLIVKRDDMATDETPSDEAAPADNPTLQLALAALENVTRLVDLLGSAGSDSAEQDLIELAEQLRTLADQLLQAAATPSGEVDVDVEARAKTAPPPCPPAPAPSPPPPPPEATPPPTLEHSLAKLTDTLTTLQSTLQEQQTRIGRLEKQFGMPASLPNRERPPAPAQDDDVGWPLDLNKPLDRQSVDKAISFHDL